MTVFEGERMRSFAEDETGGVLASVVVYAVALFILLGLVIDVGKTYSEQIRMQAYLDSVAIAAAAELDGKPDAIDRADWIIRNGVVSKEARFSGKQGESFAVDEVIYLDGPPLSAGRTLDKARIAARTTLDPSAATHILLTAEERAVSWSLLRLLSSSAKHGDKFRIGTWAAAAPVRGDACMTPLLAMCAPPGAGKDTLNVPGKQLRMVKGEDGTWLPGEYALVSDLQDDTLETCAAYTGAQRMACLLALNTHESTCETTVDIASGAGTDVGAGLNVRFDMWSGDAAGFASTQMSADVDAIMGEGRTCTGPNAGEVSGSMGLPVDACFTDGSCEALSGPVAQEELELYWTRTHGGGLPPGIATRHDAYLHEIQSGMLDPNGPEDSTFNSCNPAAPALEERRSFQIAIVDCSSISGESVSDVPVEHYAQVFLSNPVADVPAFVMSFDDREGGRWMEAGDVPDASLAPLTGAALGYDAYGGDGIASIRVKPSARAVAAYADSAQPAAARNLPMLFDTANPTGGDADLAHTTFGNMLIVSRDGDATDPDDEELGGWLVLTFDVPTNVRALRVLGADAGGVIRLYSGVVSDPSGEFRARDGALVAQEGGDGLGHDDRELKHVAIPALGLGESVTLSLGASDVRTVAVFLAGGGAVDDLTFSNALAAPQGDDAVTVEMIEIIEPRRQFAGAYPVITD